MSDFFNNEVLFSLFRVSQVPVVLILVFLCFKAIHLLGKRELFWVGLGFCFNLNYILFGILSARLLEIIRLVSPRTKNLFGEVSVISDLLATLCFLLAFVSWYYFTQTEFPQKRGIFKDFKVALKNGKLTYTFILLFGLMFLAVLCIACQFKFDSSSMTLNCIIAIYDFGGILSVTYLFVRLPNARTPRAYLIVGFGIWSVLQLITLFNEIITPNTIQLIGYSNSLFAKAAILVGFFLWYIEVGKIKERQLERAITSRETFESSANFYEEILRSTFHEIMIPIRSLDSAVENLNEIRFLKSNLEYAEVVSNFERVKAIIDVSINSYTREDLQKSRLRKVISVNNLAEITVKMIKTNYEDVNLHVFYASNCYISCNRLEIVQMITNLMKNAIEAYKHGEEKEITLRTFNSRNAETKQKEVVIEIEDHASGIPDDILKEIWAPRFSTKHVDEYNAVRGNGLAIVRQIIDRHTGSNIVVESPIRKGDLEIRGTKFKISFERKELVNSNRNNSD